MQNVNESEKNENEKIEFYYNLAPGILIYNDNDSGYRLYIEYWNSNKIEYPWIKIMPDFFLLIK
ncbi:hypothetical protein DERP_005947 [Dermatophagoides pteronyssinus]|uniref:Uncharacterized protein n=1 Tax=Dermatophagoides pteronyssinus TaxID=6956 RepID=A0ABQ8JS25_DERPT|nr:hypothetical protein DERP_005947 [Dermatophagoides pteronyssinus]